ncbi:type II secretion system F family protein [Zhihengliuella halotolerans]|uniref:Tight adherence protein B n=1 Tax=Zhihengliuella halotolerans TaxID=370736 RepID=A0A4Q8ABA1_9MICC|nr:type II secretion system F family protein [Zhihengliuella halotolerans]RZU60799.1 tight adherence protein B [Zhihengliuella halotolerans]
MNPAAWLLIGGLAAVVAALTLGVLVAFRPATSRVGRERRRPDGAAGEESTIARVGGAAVTAVEAKIGTTGRGWLTAETLEKAGVRQSPAEIVVLTIIGSAVAAALGWALAGPPAAPLFALAVPGGVAVVLHVRTQRRRATFEEQLPDLLLTLAGSLRAGHSVLRAFDAAAGEFGAPMSGVLSRIVNESRVGRNLESTMLEASERMRSEDFAWIAEAIRINREVGGDLARVLDQVGATIRERAELKGQVRALSAEGRISAYILIALPFALSLLMSLLNPGYIGQLVTHPIGLIMLVVGALMLAIGTIVLTRMTRIEF